MYKHCNTDDSARRQRQIENCLLEMMKTTPYSQITIGDICLKIGLSRKSFYRYFSSKDGCLHSLLDHCILTAASACIIDTPETPSLVPAFERYFASWKQMSPLLEALCQNRLTTTLFERTLLCMTRNNPELASYFSINRSVDFHEQLLFIVCGTLSLVLNWHHSGYQKTPQEMACTLNHLLKHSLGQIA